MAVTINAKGTSSQNFNIGKQGNGTATLSTSGSNDLQLSPGGSLILDYVSFPAEDGQNGQVLTTDGAGNLTWESVAAGGGLNNVVEDTSPQLGGNLDVNGFDIVSVGATDVVIESGSGNIVLGATGAATLASDPGQGLALESGSGVVSVGVSGTGIITTDPGEDLIIAAGSNTLQIGDTSTGSTVIATDSGEDLVFESSSGTVFFGTSGASEITTENNEDLTLKAGSGNVILGESGAATLATDPGQGLALEAGSGVVTVGVSGTGTIGTDAGENLELVPGSAIVAVTGELTTTTGLTAGDLTAEEVVYAGTGGKLSSDANFTYDGTVLTVGTFSGDELQLAGTGGNRFVVDGSANPIAPAYTNLNFDYDTTANTAYSFNTYTSVVNYQYNFVDGFVYTNRNDTANAPAPTNNVLTSKAYVDGQISGLQSQIDTINTTLSSLQSQIDALDVRVDALENP